MLAEMEINKHFSAQRQRAGDKKRASEAWKGSAQKMIMKGMMSKLRVDTVHFLQLPTGQSSTPCALSFICRQRSVLHITDDARDCFFFFSFFVRSMSGKGRHEVNRGSVLVSFHSKPLHFIPWRDVTVRLGVKSSTVFSC